MNAEKSTKKTKEIIKKEDFITKLVDGERNFRGKIFNFEINPNLLKEVISSCKKKPKKDFVEENGIININIELDFTNAIFDKKVNFKKVNFNKKVDFTEVKFTEEADFTRVEFKEEADFIRAEFKKKAKFSEVNFLNETDFIETKFEEEVDFENAIFSEDLNFSEAEFSGKANFIKAEFLKKTVFKKTKFEEEVDFEKAEFLGESDFSNFQICKTCDFEEARFLNQNNFYEINKFFETIGIDKTNFKKIKNKKIIFVRKRTILKENFFEKLRDTKRGNFKNRIFDFTINRPLLEEIFWNGSVNSKTKSNKSSKIIIDTELNFTGAVFNEKVDFTGTVFKKKINFRKSIFKNKAIFSSAIFGEENKQEKDTEVIRKNESDEKIENPEEIRKNESDEKIENPEVIRKNELDKYIAEIFRGGVGGNFEKVLFEKEARFKKTQFFFKTNFYKANFKDKASFLEARFYEETHFGHADFESIVQFSSASLLKDTDFTYTEFRAKTTFRKTEFQNKLSFYKTKFADHVNFNDSQFKDCCKEEKKKEEAVFGKTEFSKELDFENIIIEGDNPLGFNSVIFSRRYLTDFCEINVKKKEKKTEEIDEEKPAPLIFEDISFPSEFLFSRCNLSKTEFNTCSIENARFLNCDFSKTGDFPFNRDSFYVANLPFNFLKSSLKFSLVWLVIVQILLLFFPKIIEMWLSPYTIIITIVGIFFLLIYPPILRICLLIPLPRLKIRVVKCQPLFVVLSAIIVKCKPLFLFFGSLSLAGILLLSYFPYTHFGNITIGFPFSISTFIFSIIAFIFFFSVAICRKWQEKKPKKKPDRQDKGRVKFSFLVLVLILVVGVLYYARMLLSYLPDIFFGNSLPFSIILDIIVILFFLGVFRLLLKNQKKEQDRQDKEQLSRQMKSSLEASKSWKQAGDFYIDELELRRQDWLSYCGLSIYKYYLGYAERFTVILFWIFALFFYTTGFNYNKNLDYFKETTLTEKKINMLAMETGYSEECIKATNNSGFIRVCFLDSVKKSANLLIFPLTLRTQTKGFETLSDVAFVMLSWPVWLAFFIAIKRRFRF